MLRVTRGGMRRKRAGGKRGSEVCGVGCNECKD